MSSINPNLSKQGVWTVSNDGTLSENLLVKPVSDSAWALWGYNTIETREKIIINEKTWCHIIQEESSGYGGFSIPPNNNGIIIDATKNYTWSCLAKAGSKTNAELILWCHWRSTEGGTNLSQSQKRIVLSSTPQIIQWTLPRYENDTYTVNRINLMMGSYLTDNEIFFTDVKFEEGDKATLWTPNPSDTDYIPVSPTSGIIETGNIARIYSNRMDAHEFYEI